MHIITKGVDIIKKVCVYAICKNEEKFVDRWYESIKDADYICVLDTGSTDKTVDLLKKHKIKTQVKEIVPWRFDVARNESMKLIPDDADICICLDLDEVMESGWKEKLLNSWKDDTNQLRYVYNWYIESGVPKISYYGDKIHKNKLFKWVNPVHEVLKCSTDVHQTYTDDVVINHYPDNTKSRGSYLPLLELSVKEDPDNDRNMHYLGREYMYYGRWNDAIDTLIKHLNMNSATWKDERCASMRFIGRCYKNLNRFDEAEMWLKKSCIEAYYLRDPWVELALLYYLEKRYESVCKCLKKALQIKDIPKSYMNETFSNNEVLYDLLSMSYYNLGNFDKAYYYAKKALKIDKNNVRIKNNLKIFKKLKFLKCTL